MHPMTVLNDYIAKRYPRWMDYAIYQAAQAGIPDEATDLLNEVMIMLLNKSRDEMERLISMKKNGYTELDFFVLRIIKLNAHSSTSPYRSKNKPLPVDGNADYTRLDVIDDPDPDVDRSGLTLWRMQMVRFIFDNLDLSDFDRSVFEYRFFQGEPFNAWPNTDTLKELYSSYNYTRGLIQYIVFRLGIIKTITQPKGLTKPMQRHIVKASCQFMEKVDKNLLKRVSGERLNYE